MSYTIAGANVFGQFVTPEPLFPNFHKILLNETNLKVSFSRIRLVEANWAYNIFQLNDDYYVAGAWRGQENQLVKVKLPEECGGNVDMDVIVAGNDYELVVLSKKLRLVWIINLADLDDVKKFEINCDVPVEPESEPDAKKMRKDVVIVKIVVTNLTYLLLSSEGHLFAGMPPQELDTSHVTGKIIDIQSGYEHCVLITDAGFTYSWGNGRRLQLGHGDLNDADLPTLIQGLAGIKIVKICAGGWHSLAISEFGDLYAWGWNDCGQLGIKADAAKSYAAPALVDFFESNGKDFLLNTLDIACGSKHSAILLEDGSVWTTGINKYGQLGWPPGTEPVVNYFKKAFQATKTSKLKCGPWSTVIINK